MLSWVAWYRVYFTDIYTTTPLAVQTYRLKDIQYDRGKNRDRPALHRLQTFKALTP